jgi:hypothetical protein
VDALNLTQSPENGKVWVTAERVDLRASHASVHERGEWLTSPRGRRQHRAEQREGSNPGMQRHPWAMPTRGGTGNVKEAVPMVALQWDGTWSSDEAANPRGVKGPADNHP